MKKIGFNLFSVSAAFCILLSACNFNVNGGKELAEVRVGSAGPQRAADPSTGLPVFDGSNTTITITDASGRILDEGPIPGIPHYKALKILSRQSSRLSHNRCL